ncbi:shikimate dehydrogenase [Tropicibacter oceani]|uniref:Shikimate dehydrogenase (NADP(+)) n=1 Tax=Tropicibacter oceani TaxID=3058420 RepID=A0ABY8QJG5_9RHOB|nr:shikimate dehydrogenase [Tropicibacter oceani]WGW04759.1 shikimate dehydrogenase [Tropicibacter oceani]
MSESQTKQSQKPDTGVQVGLIGHGIQLSRTPAMHMQAGRALGLEYRYDLIDPDRMDGTPPLAALLDRAEASGFAGLNITYPFKKAVMQHLDQLSDAAQKVGAVNTVVFRDGKRFGHNTDFWGFAEAMRQGLPGVDLDCVLLLGAGGAGGAVAHALKDLGVQDLLIHDLSPDAAATLADQTGGHVAADPGQAAGKARGIVNATPMGMQKLPGTAIPTQFITTDHWVADIVYFPMQTQLLQDAGAKGCRTMNGALMALYQAVRAFSLFTGQTPDETVMRAAFDSFDKETT